MPGDGSLGWFDVLEMFEVLGFRRRTGKFHVLAGDDSYGVYVDRGRVILATSSNRALRLGVVLLRRGAVEPSRLQAALQPHRLSVESVEPIAIGGRLMRVGAVTRDDLAEGVQEQAIEVLSRVLECGSATVVFAHDEPLPHGVEIIPLDTDWLIAEASRRCEERIGLRAMERLLPPRNARLRLTVQLALVSFYMTDAEVLVALAVDRGNATLDGLASVLPLDRQTLRQTVIGLLERGYLEVASR